MFPLTLAILARTDISQLDNIHSGAGPEAGPVILPFKRKIMQQGMKSSCRNVLLFFLVIGLMLFNVFLTVNKPIERPNQTLHKSLRE